MVAETNYHVVDPVRSDGLMRTYVLDSKFGQFELTGVPHCLSELARLRR